MNIINKLTLRHLKENKGRTIVTTLGICVSVAMITAVFVAIASFLNFFGEVIIMTDGDYHFCVQAPKEKLVEYIERDGAVESVAYRYDLPADQRGYKLKNGSSKHASTGDWTVGDAEYLKHYITCEYDGVLPKNDKEIMVEQEFIEKNNLDWKIGDTVSIISGFRRTGTYDFIFPIKGAYRFGEIFDEKFTDEYKITGILHGNSPTKREGSSLIRLAGTNEEGTITASVKMGHITPFSISEINGIIDKFHFSKEDKVWNTHINTTYLETKFAIDPSDSVIISLLPMCLIVLLIIMIASVALIYNAFGMSYAEKVHYLGMLSSVGATKKQKRASVFFEGLVLGAVGIPIGFGAGVLGIGITLSLIGDKIIQSGMVDVAQDMDFTVTVPLYAVICILALSIITIVISILRPAIKTSEITPIDAIRQTNEIKMKKRIKTPRLIRKIFRYEGELAHKNLKRNGRKSRIITVSIALSVVMFLSCNYFCDMFTRANGINDEMPYQIMFAVDGTDFDDVEKMLSENDDIKKFYSVRNDYDSSTLNETNDDDDEIFTTNNFDEIISEKTVTKKYRSLIGTDTMIFFNYIDDADFDKLCEKNGIDKSKYYEYVSYEENPDDSDTAVLRYVVMNNIDHKDGGDKVFTDELLNIHHQVILTDKASNEQSICGGHYFGDFVEYDDDNYICHLNPSGSISCYAPVSMDYNLCKGYEYQWMYGIETDEHKKVAGDLKDYLETNDYGDGCYVNDYVEMLQSVQTVIFTLQVFIYGFIALITLITIFNIINTISTGIALRKKEFAMLKSVGTTPKGFNRMIMLESAFYGIRALIFALPVSIGINYLMYYTLGNGKIPFVINYPLYIIVTVVVFAIIGATMLYSVRKLKDDSIVETLKEEIN